MLSLSGVALAVLAPVLGAIADQGGGRKPWIGGFTAVAAVCAVLLWWIEPAQSFVLPALLLVAVGNTAFEFGPVFYTAKIGSDTVRARVFHYLSTSVVDPS